MDRSSLKLIGSIALGNALVPLNSTMIVVALPFIARESGTDLASASWLITTYLIAMAALQPIGGRIGDRFGRRRLMLGALVYFGVASIGAALATSFVLLVLFRLQQALAAALIAPNGMGILRRAAGARAGTFFGLISAISGAAASVGPLLGGLLVGIDWRWCFLVNVPLVALAIVLALANVHDDATRPETRFDVAGVVALGVLLAGTAWVLTTLAHGVDATTGVLALAVTVGWVVFLRYESGLADPALPPRLFKIRAFTAANVAMGGANLSLYATLLAIPALLASDPATALLVGGALFALGSVQIVLGPITGLLVDRFGAKWPTALGGVLIAIGSFATGALVGGGPFPLLIAALMVTGSGVAFTFPSTRVAAVDVVPQTLVALASGVVQTSRYLAGMIAAILAGAILTTLPSDTRAPVLFTIVAGSGVLTAVASLGMPGLAEMKEKVVSEVA
ncbi:MAG TPA: MFS transporter [Candidatus Limnocylindria bacterium]